MRTAATEWASGVGKRQKAVGVTFVPAELVELVVDGSVTERVRRRALGEIEMTHRDLLQRRR